MSSKGPVLFLVYTNSLLVNTQSSEKLYANEAKVYPKIRSPKDGITLQHDLKKLQEWGHKRLLEFIEEKCKVTYISRHNPGYEYYLGLTALMVTEDKRDLGVFITNNLKPS